MELHDICNGCGRDQSVCMCSVSMGPEGVVHTRPNPTNLAGKLKIIARDSQYREHQIKTQRLVDQIIWRATQAAKRGDLKISIWLSDLGITKETAEMVAEELKRDGFKCTVSNEITAMYSNTDWDSDDLLLISWE
jgi:hypothetical protein